MAKKKLFGNRKEPRCETCAHGKLSASGESVLCIQGGALPLSHSCRRYQYDPLRRVPKRRPLLGEYSAADFALDEQTAPPPAPEPVPVPEATETFDLPASPAAQDRSAFESLFEYLEKHDMPDADTILAILNKTYPPEEKQQTASKGNEADTTAEDTDNETADTIGEQAASTAAALAPDNSPDILSDLERLDMSAVPAFALSPITDATEELDPLLLSGGDADEVVFLTDGNDDEESPLSPDDLVFLPKGTPSDHDDGDDVGGGFTPLTGNE